MNKPIKILILLVVLCVLLGFLFIGYTLYPKINKQPNNLPDTILIYDTSWIALPVDTVMIPSDTITNTISDTIYQPVDSFAIISDYINQYIYLRSYSDTNINIIDSIVVYKNRLQANKIRYQWKNPTTIIDNTVQKSTVYYKYLSIGFDVPFKDPKLIELESIYHYKKGYIGVGYTANIQSFNIKIGFNIFSFRGRGVLK